VRAEQNIAHIHCPVRDSSLDGIAPIAPYTHRAKGKRLKYPAYKDVDAQADEILLVIRRRFVGFNLRSKAHSFAADAESISRGGERSTRGFCNCNELLHALFGGIGLFGRRSSR
jgi:hypothetical protein